MEEKFSLKAFIKVFNEVVLENGREIEILKKELALKDEEIKKLEVLKDYYKGECELIEAPHTKNTAGEVIDMTATPF